MGFTLTVEKKFTFSGHNAAIYTICRGTTAHSFISGGSDKYIAQWNLRTGEQDQFSAKFPSAVFSLLPLYEFGQLWVGTYNGHIHVLDLKRKEEVHAFRYHTGPVFEMKYIPEKNTVYSCSGDGSLSLFDPLALKHIHTQNISGKRIRSMEFFNGKILLAEGSGKTIILNAEDLSIEHEFISHNAGTNCHYIDEDDGFLYSGGRDAHINLWDIKNNYHKLKSIPAHNFAIYRLLNIPEFDVFATASMDKTVKIWEKKTLKPLVRMAKDNYDAHSFSVNALEWMPALNTLISASDDKTAISWEIKSS